MTSSMDMYVCNIVARKKTYKEMRIHEERIDGGKWSFGEDIKSVEDPRKIPKQRQYQTYPKLNLATKKNLFQTFIFENIYKCENRTTYELIKGNEKSVITPQPYLRKTPRGGKRIARRISMKVAVPILF